MSRGSSQSTMLMSSFCSLASASSTLEYLAHFRTTSSGPIDPDQVYLEHLVKANQSVSHWVTSSSSGHTSVSLVVPLSLTSTWANTAPS